MAKQKYVVFLISKLHAVKSSNLYKFKVPATRDSISKIVEYVFNVKLNRLSYIKNSSQKIEKR